MNSVDITVESIDLNTKVHARIECETLEDVIDVITRIEGFGGFLRAGPSATLTPPPVPAPEAALTAEQEDHPEHKAEIELHVRGAIVRCSVETETIDHLRDTLARLEHLDRVFGMAPAPEPKTPIPPLSRKGHAWTPGCVKEAQALLDQGMAYASVAARVGRTPDGVAMAVHSGRLTLPLDHPRRTRTSRTPQIFKPDGRAPQGELRLARPEDVRPAIDTMRASGAL